jgi:hypothetical protein
MRLRERVADWMWDARMRRAESTARLISIGLGAWTVVSAFRWPDRYQFASTVITGAVIAICALVAWVRVPWLRMVNTAAGVWLFFSPIVMPYQQRSLAVSQMLVALVVQVCSFIPLWSVGLEDDEPAILIHQH